MARVAVAGWAAYRRLAEYAGREALVTVEALSVAPGLVHGLGLTEVERAAVESWLIADVRKAVYFARLVQERRS
jgi:hypothetical protein